MLFWDVTRSIQTAFEAFLCDSSRFKLIETVHSTEVQFDLFWHGGYDHARSDI